MKVGRLHLAFLFSTMLLLNVLHNADASEPRGVDKLAGKSVRELIDLLDGASRSEQSAIVERLFDDIAEAVPILRGRVLGGTSNQKLLACAIIAETRDADSVETLMQAVDDPDEKVRARAIVSLGGLRAKRAADGIRRQIARTRSKTVLKASLAALGSLGSSQDIPMLRAYLSNSDESVCVNAAAAMALLGDYEGEKLLLAGTFSGNPLVRKEATYSLGFVKTAESQNRLNDILTDPNGRWKSYARIAVCQQDLSGKSPADSVTLLKELTSGQDQRVAEWALEKIADMDTRQSREALKTVGARKTMVGRKAARLLKAKEAQ